MEIQELDAALDDLEQRLERLRSLYEQYFLGLEKIEPAIARKDVDRRFFILRRTKLRNTARRFRMQLLVQRYNTFQQYWLRICRQIENGTYSRHLLKAEATFGNEGLTYKSRRRSAALAKAREISGVASSRSSAQLPATREATDSAPQSEAVSRGAAAEPSAAASIHTHPTTRLPVIPAKPGAVSSQGLASPTSPTRPAIPQAAAQSAAAQPAAAQSGQRPAAASAGSSELSEQRIKELHAQLTAEKKRLADSTGVSLDSLSKSLQEAAAKLRSIHGDRSVDFRVVVKGGKAMVKPVLR